VNILLTCHYTLPHYGGVEIVVDKLAQALERHGHKVTIISGRGGGPVYEVTGSREIIRVRSIDPLHPFRAHYPIFSPTLIPLLIRNIQKVEIVHAHGMLYQNSLLSLLLSRRAGVPTVLTDHGSVVPYKRVFLDVVKRAVILTLGRLALSSSDIVIVHDAETHKIVASLMGHKNNRLIQIQLGVDTTIFRPIPNEQKEVLRAELGWDERPKVLFVGNFVARKRVELLLEASDDRFDIVLCGEGTLPATMTRPNLLVYPAMAHEQLVKVYQAADLFVVPSKVETFCLVAFEAMACGLPVIMTYDLHHLSIAQSGLVTFVSPTPQDLRQAILDLLADRQRMNELSRKGVDWVRQHFSWELCVKQHLALYEQLLSKSK